MHRIDRHGQKGFTLMEIMVAMMILALSLTVVFQLFSGALRSGHLSKNYLKAVYHARAKMEEALLVDVEKVVEVHQQGELSEGYKWTTIVQQIHEPTANAGGTQNLVVPGGGKDLAELVAQMGTGLLVEELIGQGVNGVTGDYSRGAVGHWVENGEIRYPVHEVTIAGNLLELYPRIVAIGDDQDLRGGIRCGSLLLEEMTIAGA